MDLLTAMFANFPKEAGKQEKEPVQKTKGEKAGETVPSSPNPQETGLCPSLQRPFGGV
jgi:hypothetical protein